MVLCRNALKLTCWAAACFLSFGCASDPEPAAPPAAPAGSAVRGAEQGLEVVWWPVDDSTGALARALAKYAARPLPIDASRARSLRANGLRVIAVPLDEVDALREHVRLSGPVQRQWFGQLSQWTPVISGASWEGDRLIELDQPEWLQAGRTEESAEASGGRDELPEGLLRLGPGRLRLLARCWLEPAFSEDEASADASAPDLTGEASPVSQKQIRAALHVEVVPQHEEPVTEAAGLMPGTPGSQKAKGLVFSRLTMSAHCSGDEVLLLVPETPGARWRPVEDVSNDAPGTVALPPPIRGVERPPTLGEAMLSDAELGGFGRTKIVVLLVPRVPEDFSLLGR